jgi:hypothetical protein
VALLRTDVSEEHIAPIIEVRKISQLRKMLAVLSSLGSRPVGLMTIFSCLHFERRPILPARLCLFPTRNKVAQLYPWALGSVFVTYYDSRGYGLGILISLHLPTASQPVCPSIRSPSVINCSFSSMKCVLRELRFFHYYGVPPLMRGRVYRFLSQRL